MDKLSNQCAYSSCSRGMYIYAMHVKGGERKERGRERERGRRREEGRGREGEGERGGGRKEKGERGREGERGGREGGREINPPTWTLGEASLSSLGASSSLTRFSFWWVESGSDSLLINRSPTRP